MILSKVIQQFYNVSLIKRWTATLLQGLQQLNSVGPLHSQSPYRTLHSPTNCISKRQNQKLTSDQTQSSPSRESERVRSFQNNRNRPTKNIIY